MPIFIITNLLTALISGCQKDMPIHETKPLAVSIEPTRVHVAILPVNNLNSTENPSLFVQYQRRGGNILIECILTGISFRDSNQTKKKQGKMVVWIDGKRSHEVTSAAFIIKGLAPGDHKLKLEVVHLNNQPYGLEKEIMVNIPM
jgi:hypothetical protein